MNNNAQDFHPPTRNPQGNVIGTLQEGATNLQPVTNSEQAGLNSNALPYTSSLRVIGTNGGNNSQTIQVPKVTAEVPSSPSNASSLWMFSVGTFVVAVVLLLIARTARPASQTAGGESAKPLRDKIIEPATIINMQVKPKIKKNKKSAKKKKR